MARLTVILHSAVSNPQPRAGDRVLSWGDVENFRVFNELFPGSHRKKGKKSRFVDVSAGLRSDGASLVDQNERIVLV